MISYVADFETSISNPTYVWGFGIVNIYNHDEIKFGSSIEEFFEGLIDGGIYYFHNLKFDGTFILDYVLRNGFKWVQKERMPLHVGEFETIISKQKLFYLIRINYDGKTVEFRDSYKKLPFSVATIGRDFLHGDERKLEIDYSKTRFAGDKLNDDDKEYIKADIMIIAKALKFLFDNDMNQLTTGADSMKKFKKIYGKNFEKYFPVLDSKIDSEIRGCYKGGYTHIKKNCSNIDIINYGTTIDVNSLYPDRMVNCRYPIQEPIYFDGKYEADKFYPLYIIRFRSMFKLREGHLPTIQVKNNRFYSPTEFIEESDGLIELCMTSIDFELFQEHYNIYEIEYINGYKFRCASGIFDEYILPLYEQRQKTSGAEKTLYKLLLNSLYGKFAKNPDTSLIEPTMVDNVVKLNKIVPVMSKSVYLPVGAFITAYARYKTITTAQGVYDQFLYADTDSIHMLDSPPKWIEIDDKKLGAWKIENTWEKARFLRPKRYIEVSGDNVIKKCCGLSEDGKLNITWDNFIKGTQYIGNLKSKTVPGGIVLEDSGFILS